MPIIKVPEHAWDSVEFDRFVPGSRVEYQGASWKVVGMYFAFASAPGARESDRSIQSVVSERTKYLILQSLRLGPGALQYLRVLRSS
jgi:hypothetical protein